MFASSICSVSSSYLTYYIVTIILLSHFIGCILSQEVEPTKNDQNVAPNLEGLSENCTKAMKSATINFPCWQALREDEGNFSTITTCPILHNSTVCSREKMIKAIKILDHYCRNEFKRNEQRTMVEYAYLNYYLIGYDVCVKNNNFDYCILPTAQTIINDNRCDKCLRIALRNFIKRKPLDVATPVNDMDYNHFVYNFKRMAQACDKVKSGTAAMASSIPSNRATSTKAYLLDTIIPLALSILPIRTACI
jgi:hypothetical protein